MIALSGGGTVIESMTGALMNDELEEEMKFILPDYATSRNPSLEQILYIPVYSVGMAEYKYKMPNATFQQLSQEHFQRRRPHNTR